MLNKTNILLNICHLVFGVIQHISHHFRQLYHGGLCSFGVDINQCVDVVQRVHKEVGVDLILQSILLRLQILPLHLRHSVLVLN